MSVRQHVCLRNNYMISMIFSTEVAIEFYRKLSILRKSHTEVYNRLMHLCTSLYFS
jgi:hypothetical protein